jgi:TonB-linked SusC/RagA family outer membrane protein
MKHLFVILLLIVFGNTYGQGSFGIVKGTVTDNHGTPLHGATVTVKGESRSAVTDNNGSFEINAGKDNSLVVSFVGYETQTVAIEGRSVIYIMMEASFAKGLDEVVVVGYGEQKKVNLTGSVATISSSELIKRPTANVQNLLQGKVSGLQVVQNSGQPGDDDAVLTIRGQGTFSDGGNAPLVLIDGVVGDMTTLNADNIESISVLKDAASASIYGARAANGVILVTTKKGKSGALTIDYRANFQLQRPTAMPDLVTNSADFMEYFNMARLRSSQNPLFTQTDIDNYRNATDRVKFPNFNWIDYMINNAWAQNHYLSASGGSDKTTYNIALGYLDQDGVLEGHDYKRYNLNINIDSKVKKNVTIGGSIAATNKLVDEPVFTDDNFMLTIYAQNPTISPYLSDGSGRLSSGFRQGVPAQVNPVGLLAQGGKRYEKYNVMAQSYIDVQITKDLSWGVKGAANFTSDFSKLHDHPVDLYWFSTAVYRNNGSHVSPGVTDNFNQSLLTTLYSTLNYNKYFGMDHTISALVGYNQESFRNRFLQANRPTLPADNLTELDAGSLNGQSNSGTSYEWAIQSFFGRLNYNYKEKYLLEANFRYDGTSRIYQANRWGVFPSISAGWRLSNEEFLKDNVWVDNLKVRASWGKLGNQNIGNYPYQDILSTTSYPFSGLEPGVVQTRLTDKNLKWETTTITDIGVDFSLKNGLISGTLDWYNKVTDGILYNIEIPLSVGLTAPTVNYAKMQNKGFELALNHANRVGELRYSVNGNISINKNEVLKVKAPFYSNYNTIQEGLPWMSNYMVEWIGIFQSVEEIQKSPTQPYNPKPGDLKFKDQNNDGKIDANDRVVVDGAYPDFIYAGGFNLSWKRFDMSAFFQGLKGTRFFVDRWGQVPFTQSTPPTKEFVKNAWTETNKTNIYPAMYQDGYGPVTGTPSTFFLQDGSYLRLKNLVVGYTLQNLSKKLKMKDIRVYLSGDNFITLTKYPSGADPERLGVGRQRFATYPQLKIFSAGLNVKF